MSFCVAWCRTSKINNTIRGSFTSPMEEPGIGPAADPLVSPTPGKSGRFSHGQWIGRGPQPETMRIPEGEPIEGINNLEGGLISGILEGSLPEEEAWEQQGPTIDGSIDELAPVGHGIILNPAGESQQGITIKSDPLQFSSQNNDSFEIEPIVKQQADSPEGLRKSGQKNQHGTASVPQNEPNLFEDYHFTSSEMEDTQSDLEETNTSIYPPEQESNTTDLVITTDSGADYVICL